MKKLLFPLPILLVLSLATRGQTIQSTPATPHTLGAPTHTPSTYGSNIAYDKTNKIFYRWTGSAWTASLPGAVADGDKGDITVSSTGTNWQLDATSVGNTELASGVGGVYKGSGTSPSNTTVTVTDDLSFRLTGTDGFLVGTAGENAITITRTGTTLGCLDGDDLVYYFVMNSVSPSAVFTDAGGGHGIEYAGDYSAGYSTRSLVDKAYVDAANATNANLTGPVTSVGNATTITANSIDSTHISNGTISPNDLAQRGASVGQVMTYTSNGWRPAAAGGSTPTLQQVTDEGAATTNSITAGASISLSDPNNLFIVGTGTTDDRTYTLPDASGTFLVSVPTLQEVTDAGNSTESLKIASGADGSFLQYAGGVGNYDAFLPAASGNVVVSQSATATLNFPSTAASTCSDLTITVTGAADGNPATPGVPNASILANGSYSAWVSASNTVTVRFCNHQAVGALDPASGTFRATVLKY